MHVITELSEISYVLTLLIPVTGFLKWEWYDVQKTLCYLRLTTCKIIFRPSEIHWVAYTE